MSAEEQVGPYTRMEEKPRCTPARTIVVTSFINVIVTIAAIIFLSLTGIFKDFHNPGVLVVLISVFGHLFLSLLFWLIIYKGMKREKPVLLKSAIITCTLLVTYCLALYFVGLGFFIKAMIKKETDFTSYIIALPYLFFFFLIHLLELWVLRKVYREALAKLAAAQEAAAKLAAEEALAKAQEALAQRKKSPPEIVGRDATTVEMHSDSMDSKATLEDLEMGKLQTDAEGSLETAEEEMADDKTETESVYKGVTEPLHTHDIAEVEDLENQYDDFPGFIVLKQEGDTQDSADMTNEGRSRASSYESDMSDGQDQCTHGFALMPGFINLTY